MNLMSPELQISQFNDNQTYSNTMLFLNSFDPVEILLSDSSLDSTLHKLLGVDYAHVKIENIRRKYFNENQGLQYIHRHGLKTSIQSLQLDSSKYLCLAAAACLMKYIEFIQNMTFAPASLKITFKALDGHMRLDVNTVKTLELVHNIKNPRLNKSKGSLFAAYNQCKTFGGARLLRSTILQPLFDRDTITGRLDVVEEILSNEELFFGLNNLLPQFADIDNLSANLVQVPKNPTQRTRQALVMNVLLLKKSIELLPDLVKFLSTCKSPLLKAAASNFDGKSADSIGQAIDKVLDPSATISKKIPTRLRIQVAFSIRAGVNGFLDVARATFSETLEEIHGLIERYKQELQSNDIRQQYTVTRGYHVSIPCSIFQMDGADTSKFVQRVRRGNRVNCSSEELISLNDRQRNAFNEITVMAESVLQDLLSEIREHMGWLIVLAESLAFVDMMLSFANTVSLNDGFVRPEFVSSGPLAIKQGRHPILHVMAPQHLVANNTYLCEASNLHMVTGPNCSGKSTYIRQVGLLTILAHLGSYVPAEFASFRLTDQVLTCLQHNDDLEGNVGTFFSEMTSVNYALKQSSHTSLVLIDEMGRGTSTLGNEHPDSLSLYFFRAISFVKRS